MDDVTDLENALPMASSASFANFVHIEVCQNISSTAKPTLVKDSVMKLIERNPFCYSDFTITEFEDPFMKEHIQFVSICETEGITRGDGEAINLCDVAVQVHVFQLQEDGPGQEELDDEDLAAANHWLLPSADFHGMWENLIFDHGIKQQLLQYATTTLLFSDRGVDSNIITWNRVVLLHGPPGTGKTSLCKALAQKLTIYLSERYTYGQLIEINSHSLFSKWFSESGKLVMKMFQKIQELIDDPEALVCVLIDEVESLTAARKASMAGTEPSDAIRVVNALLTQIDQIKKYPNVVVLTTSNITGAIDLAFVDRADIKQYIGPPSYSAIYKIYQGCLNELMRTGIIKPKETILELKTLDTMQLEELESTRLSLRLRDIAIKSEGLSGRALRKIPFIAHAAFIQAASATLPNFLEAISLAVDKQFLERKDLTKDT